LEQAVLDFGGLGHEAWNSGDMRSSDERTSPRKPRLDRKRRSPMKQAVE
jgi:hypothetical protein